MPTPSILQGARIYIESARGAVQALSAITKAAPPVITYAGADPSNNDYMIITGMTGMTQLNDAVVKVANVNGAGNTFEAKDQDSTNFGTFVSGNMYPVTFGSELTVAMGAAFTGGEPQYANYMLLWDDMERRKFTHASAAGIDLPVMWDPSDTNFQYLYNLARTDSTLAVKIVLKSGVEILSFGNFGGSGQPTSNDARSIMQASFSINPTTKPWYVLP